MATYHEALTIKKGETHTEAFQLKAHERVVGITTSEWGTADIGMDIEVKDLGWFPIRDGIEGDRARLTGIKENAYHVVPDYGHPLSDIGDDKVRFVAVSVDTTQIELKQDEDRTIYICVRMYE